MFKKFHVLLVAILSLSLIVAGAAAVFAETATTANPVDEAVLSDTTATDVTVDDAAAAQLDAMKTQMLARYKAQLDAAVAAEYLTQDQADTMYAAFEIQISMMTLRLPRSVRTQPRATVEPLPPSFNEQPEAEQPEANMTPWHSEGMMPMPGKSRGRGNDKGMGNDKDMGNCTCNCSN